MGLAGTRDRQHGAETGEEVQVISEVEGEQRRVRRALTVQGIVQGVGFRPFVHQIACEQKLSGFALNRSGIVSIEIEGPAPAVEAFVQHLQSHPPPLARITAIHSRQVAVRHETQFVIRESEIEQSRSIFVSPDMATCADCLAELFCPDDRRFGYPFINCTHCGPRLTIIEGAPYDRERTTMARFKMCAACRAEYEDPQDRRFHAQPNACPECGPRLRLLDPRGEELDAANPLQHFAEMILAGGIGGLKGLGGYHLVCRASSAVAVSELRKRKQRDAKPFALMVATIADVERLCEVEPLERDLLQSLERPIVLLRRREGIQDWVAEGVAPGCPELGIMLPYTPLHHLLLKAAGESPLVMTSGNEADEPIAYRDDDAITRLGPVVDLLLTHDRAIRVRCDDSVVRVVHGEPLSIRRSRGYAPTPLNLPGALKVPALAVGGQLKGTFALGRGALAFPSHHLGDLDYYSAFEAFQRDVMLYEDLFEIRPEVIVHDLHPDYATTRYAVERAARAGLQLLAVQHHHAHVASVMAERGLSGPVIGVAWDGTGYGPDGVVWGSEFFVADYGSYERMAHLREIGLPGGDAAIRQPWRMALAYALDAGLDIDRLPAGMPRESMRTVRQMLERRINTPVTTSAGRLFDAVAALLDVRQEVSHEGQAAMELEWLAAQSTNDEPYAVVLEECSVEGKGPTIVADPRPLIRELFDDIQVGVDKKRIARRFHFTMIELIATVCCRLREIRSLNRVVLSGGVFMNRLISEGVTSRLRSCGFDAFLPQCMPPNDAGLSFGQLAVAAALFHHQSDSSY